MKRKRRIKENTEENEIIDGIVKNVLCCTNGSLQRQVGYFHFKFIFCAVQAKRKYD